MLMVCDGHRCVAASADGGREAATMIELSGVSIRSESFALHDISFSIATGQYAVMMGRTGTGKTTILESICGLRRIASGSVKIHSHDVTKWSPRDRQIGYCPQDLALFPNLTVREHLEFGLRLRKASSVVINNALKSCRVSWAR